MDKKLQKIIGTADIDWSRLMWCNVPDREELYIALKDRLTSAQIDELYNAMPINITGNRFYEVSELCDYVSYAISLFKRGVVDIDMVYGIGYE